MAITEKDLKPLGFIKIKWKEIGKRESAYSYEDVVLTQFLLTDGFFFSFLGEDEEVENVEHLQAIMQTIFGEETTRDIKNAT